MPTRIELEERLKNGTCLRLLAEAYGVRKHVVKGWIRKYELQMPPKEHRPHPETMALMKRGLKRCSKCRQTKAREAFHASGTTCDGKQSHCQDCRRPIARVYMRKRCADPVFRERIRINHNRAYHRNKESKREHNNALARARYAKNVVHKRAKHYQWREANRDKLRQQSADRIRMRRQTDPAYRTLCNLRCRVNNALKAKVVCSKSRNTKDLLGCEFDTFLWHLEKQFRPGMTWVNYGRVWHIDHIKPCVSFDLTDPVQQAICFHFTNLQPLWATTSIAVEHGDMTTIGNINKGNRSMT